MYERACLRFVFVTRILFVKIIGFITYHFSMDNPNNNLDVRTTNSDMNTILIIVILLILVA